MVAPKGANSMAAYGLSCRRPLVGPGWAIAAIDLENSLLAM